MSATMTSGGSRSYVALQQNSQQLASVGVVFDNKDTDPFEQNTHTDACKKG
jgi:hypothetical protein